ncbi:DUF4190 domain-containing protein [Streptomyces sp. NPDC059009]|uniref:DUF4190 domain-containing protein n=1 Tax=Streptomyces sp. NPDC059009 TaxID=3346694 RepID=UPI0036AF26B1
MTTPRGSPPPPPQWGPPPQPPPGPELNGLGTASLVLGIIGVLCGLTPLLFWAAGVLAVLALVFGCVGIRRANRGQATNRKTAIWGTSLGAVAAVLAVVGLVITVTVVNDTVDKLNGTGGKKESSTAPIEPPGRRPQDSDGLGFGDTFAYDDGVKVTVARPTAYRPSEFALGHSTGDKPIEVKITIVNGSDKAVDLNLSTVTFKDADGAEADKIFDGDVPREFAGTLAPGKQAVATYAVSLPADAASALEVEVEPGFLDYEDAGWTGTVK